MSLQVRLGSTSLRSCVSCGFSTRHSALYDRHVKRCSSTIQQTQADGTKLSSQPHLVNRNYRCKRCNFTTTKSKMFLFHQKDVHSESINIFPCDLCDYASRYKCKVMRHRKFIHPNAKDIDGNDLQQEDDEILALEAQEDAENMTTITAEFTGEDMEEKSGDESSSPEGTTHHIDVDSEIQIRVKYEGSKFEDIDQENMEVNGDDLEQQAFIAELTTPQPKANENAFDYIRKLSDSPGGPVYQCKLCTYTNMQKWKVANHVRSFHMKKKLFKCQQCDFVTGRKIEFCIHKTKHSSKKVFSCEECGYRTVAHANYDRHMANHKADSPVKCQLCTYSSTGEAAIQRHMQEYHSSVQAGGTTSQQDKEAPPTAPPSDKAQAPADEDVQCPLCELVFKSDSRLKIHLVSHSSESSHQCPLCILKYKRASDLNRHMKRKHNIRLRDYSMGEQDEPLNLTTMKRPKMDTDEDQPLDLSLKQDEPHPPPAKRFGGGAPTAPENLKCSHCSYLAKWPSDLHRHMLVHSVEKRFKCTYCHRRYKYKFDLNMHLRKMHKVAAGRTKVPSIGGSAGNMIELSPQDKVLPPTPPTYMTARAATVVSPTNSDAYSFGNDDGESFRSTDSSEISPSSTRTAAESNQSTSRKPMVIHPLRPSAAEKLLKSPRQLNLSPSGKFKCEFCPYLGACRSEVDRHMRLHTGEKPYNCLFCTYKSHWKGDMKRHIQKHHGDQYSNENDICEIMLKTYQPERAFEHVNMAAESKPVVTSVRSSPSPTPPPGEIRSDSPMVPPNAVVTNTGELMQPSSVRSQSAGPDTSPRKQNVCPYCPFVCEAPSKLKCHMEIHENLKRFKCAYCGKRSNWTWDVRKHIKKDHPGAELNVIVMPEDEARTSLADYLQTHKSPVRRVLEFSGTESGSEERAALEERMAMEERESTPSKTSTTSDLIDMVIDDGGNNASEILEQFLAPPVREPSLPPPPVSVVDNEALSMVSMAPPGNMVSSAPTTFTISSSMRGHSAATERYRPFKCSKCGKRSNWRWDLRKHIRQSHPNARVIEMTREEAMANWPPEKPKTDAEMGRPTEEAVLPPATERISLPAPTSMGMSLPVALPSSTANPLPATKYVQQVDLKRLKRFKCHLCPYRSNYRSDIGRHSKRLHRKSPYKVIVLDEEEAATTLQVYKDTFGHKKFVLSPARSRISSRSGHSLSSHVPETRQHSLHAQQPGHHPEGAVANQSMDVDESDHNIDAEPPAEIKLEPMDDEEEADAPKSGKVKVWKCSRCDFRSKNKMLVLQHLKSHPKVKVFRCRMCGEESDYRNSMYRHIRNRHNTTDYTAAVIESVAFIDPKTKERLDDSGNTTEEGDGSVTYRCILCGQTSKSKSGILRHTGEKHPDQDGYSIIETVRDAGTDDTDDENRMQIDLDEPEVEVKESSQSMPAKNLACDVCPYRTNKTVLLSFHRAYHRPQQGHKYKCKFCPYYVSAPRLLHQHVRLHVGDKLKPEDAEPEIIQELAAEEVKREESQPAAPKSPPHESGGRKHFSCDQCPFMCRNKNDFIYHKQFHKEKPTAPFKCSHCNYWVAQRRLLAQHNRVHAPEYAINFRNGTAVRGVTAPQPTDPVVTSPARSESDIDAVDVAHIKQQIITSKIYSTPITPDKFEMRGADKASPSDNDNSDVALMMEGYLVNKSGHLLKSGALRKLHKCAHCPYTNVRATNLRLHESMHGSRPGKDLFKCPYCDYYVGNKGLLSHHVKVHSNKYEPGKDEINDIEYPEDESAEKVEGSEGEEGLESIQEQRVKSPSPVKQETPNIIDAGPQLNAGSLPNNTEFYVKYDDLTGEHVLERVNVEKWCCEKCPYATLKQLPFERHVVLHGSRQKYVCDYCDYSVPGYQMLLQHKKLHLQPNPNLLSLQSIANLHRLPELAADRAVASNFPASTTDPSSQAGTHDHLALYENSKDFVEPKKMYRCDRCPYTNIRRENLLAHLKFHMIQSSIQCSYCDYSVDKQHLLMQHIKVHFTNALDLFDSPTKSQREDEGNDAEETNTAADQADNNNSDTVRDANTKKRPSSNNNQPEYIDISELGKVVRVDPKNVADQENNNNNDQKENKDKNTEKKIGREEGRSRKGVPVKRVIQREAESNSEGTMWICQYCDRAFSASDKLLRHEMQHLVGNHF